MPPPTPEPIRALIQEEFEKGYTNDAILAGNAVIKIRTLQNLRAKWVRYGTVFIPDTPGGRPSTIPDIVEQELLAYLEQRPMAYLDEMAYFLFDEFDLTVDESTVWRYLHRLGWSHTKSKRKARQRNTHLRNSWFAKLADWRADQLIFLDKSAACERTGDRDPPLLGVALLTCFEVIGSMDGHL